MSDTKPSATPERVSDLITEWRNVYVDHPVLVSYEVWTDNRSLRDTIAALERLQTCEFALNALVAIGHVTQEQVDGACEIAKGIKP